MDFTVAGNVLAALLLVIPAITAYFRRQSRAQRRENRRLRALVQEYDVHLYTLERKGWTSRGVRPPTRPELLKALAAEVVRKVPVERKRSVTVLRDGAVVVVGSKSAGTGYKL